MPARSIRTLARLAWSVLLAWPLLSASATPGGAAADGVGDWARGDKAELRLVSATGSIAPGQEAVRLGLHVRLEEGWKIYWRSPGSAGLPPEVAWEGSDNLAAARLLWPSPKRFELFGLQSFGYAGEVVLPIEARLAAPGEPAALRARVTYLVCREICIPGEALLSLDLAAGPGAPSDAAHLISRFAGRVPAPAHAAAITLTAEQAAHGLVVTARSPLPLAAPDLFVETDGLLDLPAPAVTLSEGGLLARFQFPRASLPAGTVATLTLVDGPLAVESRATVTAASQGIGAILPIALLGGLLLNLMPCVLPVLAMKMAGLAALAGKGRAVVRLKLAATGAGVVGSMLLLGISTH
ncbi:MAG: protein-disulfide reductase DsbD domain-containing protein, partial [Acetobacteraceae bacterium]